jgi:XTP/dITP diphosphohydrolase
MADFLILATANAHKASEISEILGKRFRYLTLKDFPALPPLREDGTTFEGNALQKAEQVSQGLVFSSLPPALAAADSADSVFVLADDSGLEVDALGGAPGVHSARFAALGRGHTGNSPDQANNEKLLNLLARVPDDQRTARFRCVLALIKLQWTPRDRNEFSPVIPKEPELSTAKFCGFFIGVCEGKIARQPAGIAGFGYDPLFIPRGWEISFGELEPSVKNQLSHRAQALGDLRSHSR